jgi:hypothetical protein
MIAPMGVWRRRISVAAGFALVALVAQLVGRELTQVVDRALHVRPLAAESASYYPVALVAVKVLAALALAVLAWRIVRALSTAAAGERLLAAVGHRPAGGVPRPRLKLSPRLWLGSFLAMSIWYLLQSDAGVVADGRWPLLAPWLHTYALPVFAVVSVLVALAWAAVRDWLAEVEQYAAATLARAARLLRASRLPQRPAHPAQARAPRSLFGLAFESRPPPRPA